MAARAVSLGGVGAALSAEDVLRVACGAPCALDVAVITKLERDAPAPTAQSVRARALDVRVALARSLRCTGGGGEPVRRCCQPHHG